MSSTQQDENELVERVFLRIGSAESDDELQAAVAKFLSPLLLKLNSQNEGVRSKVVKLLAHIKTRLKSRSQIQLPLDALLTQFQDPEATPFITNFTILFIKMGFSRTDVEKQAELVPLLMNCLEGRSVNHQDSLLQLIIPALQYLKMPKTKEECRAKFLLHDKPVVKQLLLNYFMDLLLLPYNSHVTTISSNSESGTEPGLSGAPPNIPIPPGLSKSAFQRLTAENPLGPDALEKAKISIVKFLSSEVVEEKEAVCLYVVATSDTRHSVATSADLELKRITGSIDWNSKQILTKLFSIFLGTVVIKGMEGIKPDDRRSPVSTRIRLKIFPFFLKAREASNMFPACLQTVFDCLFGATPNPKLRLMAVQLVHHICLNGDDAKFSTFDAVFLNGMLKVIDQATEDDKLRSLAYIAVGKIGRRSPHRLTKDISVVQKFFDAMCKEEGDTRLAVQEAMSLMSDAFRNLDETNKKLMEALLLQNIDKDESQARSVAVQYGATVFPSDHIPSRYILMLGAGDIKDDIRLESVKGLRGTQSRGMFARPVEKIAMPNFVDMLNYVSERGRLRRDSKHRHMAGNTVLPFHPSTYSEILIYLRMCLAQTCGLPVDWDLESLPEQVPVISAYVKTVLSQREATHNPLHKYIEMLRELLVVSTNAETMYCLLEVVAMVPDVLAASFQPHKEWIKRLLCSSKDEIKLYASELYAVIAFHSSSKMEFFEELEDLQTLLENKVSQRNSGVFLHNPELALGALLTLGFMIGLHLKSERLQSHTTMETLQNGDENKQISKAVEKIASFLCANGASTRSRACMALGEIGRNAPLPIADGEQSKETGSDDATKSGTFSSDDLDEIPQSGVSKLWIIEKLIAMVKTSNEDKKTKEKATMCLGYICVGDDKISHRRKAIEDLIKAIQSKQVDLQFTIGQALVCMAMGPKSPNARCTWTTSKEDHQKSVSELKDEAEWFLGEVLSKYICHANPHLRQGACIWLLTLIRQAGHLEAIQTRLLDIQRGFMRLLSENDDITQDMASKGLGQIMEVCTPQQKDSLVSELVETLMTGKSAKNEVSASTAVFESGTLGNAPDGGGISTYKELCAIATDLNQPDLIYKFMHLANHNASWNTRKGAAFGFSTIASQAGEQLAPYLTQIVPRLYRYQFDPNPKIQQAMSGIWNALVQDNKKTVDTYLKEILRDLLKNLTSNQWRVRESSCLAVSDLLRGRVLDDIIEDIPSLWEECLKVRDDIKESVRLAAESACKTLSRVSVKICDITNGKVGVKAIQLVLPCLLHCSLQSSVKEVRAIGLSTILEISRNAGSLLKPNIPVLVTALLEAVSGLEPQVINYLSLHMGTQANQEKLDSARIAASKSSPMMETVNRCVQYIDDTVLPELIPRLVELIRGGIGVSTKAGCSSFTVSLIHQCPQDLSPYAGKLMSAFLHGVNDRNATVRKSYATALGYLVRLGKDSSVEKLILRLKTWYMANEATNTRHACSVTLHAISRHSPDVLSRHANVAMPLAFFAMHEESPTEEETKKKEEPSDWEDVWNEATPGTESGIRLYLPELVTLLSSCLQSQDWSVKGQAGRGMATIATKLGSQLGPPHLGNLLNALLDGLSGRTWTGKDSLLKALSAVCTSCKEAILQADTLSNQPSLEQILTVVLRESNKEQVVYKMAAFQCLGPILELYEVDHFKAVWEISQPIVKALKSKEKDDDTDVNQKQQLIQCTYTLLGEAWPYSPSTQDEKWKIYADLLCSSMSHCTWKVQIVLVKNMQKMLNRLRTFEENAIPSHHDIIQDLIKGFLSAALSNLSNTKFVSLRCESLILIETILLRLKACDQLVLVPTDIMSQLKEDLPPLVDTGPWELRDRAKTLTKALFVSPDSTTDQAQAMEH